MKEGFGFDGRRTVRCRVRRSFPPQTTAIRGGNERKKTEVEVLFLDSVGVAVRCFLFLFLCCLLCGSALSPLFVGGGALTSSR